MRKRGRPKGKSRERINLSFDIPLLGEMRTIAKRDNIKISHMLENLYKKSKRRRLI